MFILSNPPQIVVVFVRGQLPGNEKSARVMVKHPGAELQKQLFPLLPPVQEHHAREDAGEDDLHPGKEEGQRPDCTCDLEERAESGCEQKIPVSR